MLTRIGWFILGVCSLWLVDPAAAQDSLPTVEESRARYEEARERVERAAGQSRERLLTGYADALEVFIRQAQEGGDLDNLLLGREEQERARMNRDFTEALPTTAPRGFRQLREGVETGLIQIRDGRAAELERLRMAYLAHVQSMEREHTRRAAVEQAMAFRAEAERVGGVAAPAPPADPVAETSLFSLSWNPSLPEGQAEIRRDAERAMIPIVHEGDNRITSRALELRGGVSRIADLGEEMAKAFQASNEFCLIVELESRGEDQRGPARILSFSLDHGQGNFTLGQQGDQLVMRLRTSRHEGTGGPDLPLGEIRENRASKLVFTHRAGVSMLFRDGKEIALPGREGDFSNWQAWHLVLGNEHNGDRAWMGRIQAFQLTNRAINREQALQMSER